MPENEGLMSKAMPKSIDETQALLAQGEYVADRSLATSLFLSLAMKRPLFLEGEAGVGKTEIAKVVAQALGRELIRLQCYEGLDIAQAAYEWNYPRQMIEIRMAEAEGVKSREGLEQDIFSERFLIRRPLLRALQPLGEPPVLLIDELDRTDEPFEAYLLEVLSDWQITIPEIGTVQGRRAAGGDHHLQPHARNPRRGEAALLLPLGGLSRREARARDPAAQGAESGRRAFARGGGLRAAAAQGGSVQAAGRGRDHRLGELPGGARPRGARPGDGQQHARRAAQVPRRPRAHRRRRSRAAGRRSEGRRAAA